MLTNGERDVFLESKKMRAIEYSTLITFSIHEDRERLFARVDRFDKIRITVPCIAQPLAFVSVLNSQTNFSTMVLNSNPESTTFSKVTGPCRTRIQIDNPLSFMRRICVGFHHNDGMKRLVAGGQTLQVRLSK